ncbi:patatin-like phospholipase family protein [Chloroflexota bacterium]
MRKRKRKIGLALGSGTARGLAHIGVLEVLEEEGIPIDIITGTSIGAVISALYAQGKDASVIKKLVSRLSRRQLASLVDLALPRTGLIQGEKIKSLLESVIGGDIEFSTLRIPFACVATDIRTSEEVVISHGSLLEALRASFSVPAVFTLVKWEGRYVVDGGLVNPVPVSVARQMGADFVIAVNVLPDIRHGSQWADATKGPGIINIIIQSLYISTHSAVRSSLEGADIVIEPQVADIDPLDFFQAEKCISQGKLATQDAIPEIRKRIHD